MLTVPNGRLRRLLDHTNGIAVGAVPDPVSKLNTMVIVRPTKKALLKLGIDTNPTPPETTSSLGDWYLNVVGTLAGELFVFVNAATLLAIAVPTREANVYSLFVMRVANLLAMIGLPSDAIEDELQHYQQLVFAKPISRRIQGSANEIAFQLQTIAEREVRPNKPLSLSDAERYLSEIPHAPLEYQYPREIALEILRSGGRVA